MKTKNTLLLLGILILNFGLNAQNTKTDIEYADSLYKNKEYKEAIIYYNKLIILNDKDETLFVSRAKCYNSLKKFQKGIEDNNKAIIINPKCSNCYLHNSISHLYLNKYEKALVLVNKSIDLNDTVDLAYLIRANIYTKTGEDFKALSDYEKAIKLNPKNPKNYTSKALFDSKQGYDALALSNYNKAIGIDSTLIFPLYMASRIYISKKQWSKAKKYLKKCVQLDSTNAEYYFDLGGVYYYLRDYKKSLKSYSISIAIDSTIHASYLVRAYTRIKLEDMEGTCADYFMALKFIKDNAANKKQIDDLKSRIAELCNNDNKSYYYQRGIALYNLKKYNEAVIQYNLGLKKFPNSPLIHSFKANTLLSINKFEEAIKHYKLSLKNEHLINEEIVNSNNKTNNKVYKIGIIASNYGSIAECYVGLNDFKSSLLYIDTAIDISLIYQKKPEFKHMLSTYYRIKGIYFHSVNNLKESEKYFLKSLKMHHKNINTLLNLTFLYASKQSIKKTKYLQTRFSYTNKYNSFKGDLPIIKIKPNKVELKKALIYANKAIEINEEFAFAYFVRAQIKKYLGQPYCTDIKLAKGLGIKDADKILGVNCEGSNMRD